MNFAQLALDFVFLRAQIEGGSDELNTLANNIYSALIEDRMPDQKDLKAYFSSIISFLDVRPPVRISSLTATAVVVLGKISPTVLFSILYEKLPTTVDLINQLGEIRSRANTLEQQLADKTYEANYNLERRIQENVDLTKQIVEKDQRIATLENQVQLLQAHIGQG